MASHADQRLLDLLEKWLSSLELHLKYSSLDEVSYSQIQPWPVHQRPNRWIIELAKQKALDLRKQVQERVTADDATFADSLEQMIFLANLLGAEHIERYIPFADANTERMLSLGVPLLQDEVSAKSTTGTREMPKFDVTQRRATPHGASTPSVTHTVDAATGGETRNPMHDQVIADAARLVQWGRKWYELAELISAMADRPNLIEVRRILLHNKAIIDKKAGRL